MGDSVVLVVGSGAQLYREYLLLGAQKRHSPWLLDGAPATWQQQYVRGSSTAKCLKPAHFIPDHEDFVAAAEKLGYPVIIKPRGLGASAGVVRAATSAEVKRAASVTLEQVSEVG